MELPKNIVQIGSPDKHYKIFVEDYVISYIKQVNRYLGGGHTGIALYGKKYVEEEVRYFFLYGASEIPGIENRGQYLSELEREQVESQRREFFEDWEFLAWCTLSGELPDGFWLLEQGKGMLINGYATFFEKNEHMLNFMIIIGNRERQRGGNVNVESIQPEMQERAESESRYRAGTRNARYEWGRLAQGGNIDHRLSERSRKLENARGTKVDKYEKTGGWKTLLTGAAVMVCVIGIATLSDEEKMKNLQVTARQIFASFHEQKLPDESFQSFEEIETENYGEYQTEPTVIATPETQPLEENVQQDTLTEQQVPAMQQNSSPQETSNPAAQEMNQIPQDTQVPETSEQPNVVDNVQTVAQPENPPAGVTQEQPQVQEPIVTTVTYVVERGDKLLKICREKYGSEERLKEICELNGIENPDDIKVGQIILLPE